MLHFGQNYETILSTTNIFIDRDVLYLRNEVPLCLLQVCESDNLPLTDPSARAVLLTPKQWREKLEKRSANRSDAGEDGDLKNVKKVLLLDVRNSMFSCQTCLL